MDMAPISASNTHGKSLVTLYLFPCEPHDPMVDCGPTGNKQPQEKTNLAWMRFMTDEEIKEEERHNVSTNLTLYTDPWTIKKEMTKTNKQPQEKTNLAWMRFMTDEEIKEEERHNVSTNLTLYTDPWTIKKEMTKTSLGYLSRLFLYGNTVRSDILRYLSMSDQRLLEDGFGLSLEAYDDDTGTMHNLVLKKWHNCASYVLLNGWRMDFVVRRALKEGDVIGMYWDPYGCKLHFCVLSRAPIRASSGSAAMGSSSFAPRLAGP